MFEVRELKKTGLTLIADTADQWAFFWLLEKASQSRLLEKQQRIELGKRAIKLREKMDKQAGKEKMETGAEGEKLLFTKDQTNALEQSLQTAIDDPQITYTNRDKAVYYAILSAIDAAEECKKTMGIEPIRAGKKETAELA